jgi:hypothetical protein
MKSYSGTMMRLAAATCSVLLITTSVFSQQKPTSSESRSNAERNSMKDQPIACNLLGLTPAERQRQKELRDQIFSGTPTVKELTNGYAVGLPSTRESILSVAEFISLERVCCSFFHFDLAVGQSEEPLWLRITGKSGVKEFLKTELMKR